MHYTVLHFKKELEVVAAILMSLSIVIVVLVMVKCWRLFETQEKKFVLPITEFQISVRGNFSM
jgi:chromate transport protein ChrA